MQNPYDLYQQNQKPKKAKKPKRKPKARKRSQSRAKKPVESKGSLSMIFGSLLGLTASFYIVFYTEDFLALINKVELGINTSAAAEGEKTATESAPKEAKKSQLPVGQVSQLKADVDQLTMKNASVYKALREKRRELEKKERRLAQLEEELQIQKVEIEKQLKEMQEMRTNISSRLDRKVAADQESIDKLVGVYSNMKPKNAAIILSSVDEDLAIKVLGKMKKQNAAAILNFVNPKKAQDLSEKFTGLKR